MKNLLLGFIILCFFIKADVFGQNHATTDTIKIITLNPNDSKIVNKPTLDSAFISGNTNLHIEIISFKPNLLYKNRLDSISTNIHLDYNKYVQDYIDVLAIKRKSEMGKMLGLGHYYFPIFERALATYRVPEEFKYLPIVESSMNPMAVSKSGATGLWQFMYTTGKVYGLKIDDFVDERRDPTSSSYAAAAYLQDAYREFGDWLLALAAYNCGGGNVRKAILKAGVNSTFWDIQPYLPAETRSYVPAFIATNYIMNYYSKHDVKVKDEANIKTDSVYVKKYVSFQKIAMSLNMDLNDLMSLNPSYKRNIINGSLETPKRLIIPKISSNKFASVYEALNADEDQSLKIVAVIDKPQNSPQFSSITHIVKKGENLNNIATHYLVAVEDLMNWNDLKNSDLTIGQKLKVSKR